MSDIFISYAREREGEAERVEEALRDPGPYGYLAASYGHLGQTTAGREALAKLRLLSPQYISNLWDSTWQTPADLALFMDGVALAEGEGPGADAASV